MLMGETVVGVLLTMASRDEVRAGVQGGESASVSACPLRGGGREALQGSGHPEEVLGTALYHRQTLTRTRGAARAPLSSMHSSPRDFRPALQAMGSYTAHEPTKSTR